MASTFVKSLRIAPELWAKVEAYAAEHNLSANSAVVHLLGWALEAMRVSKR